MKPADFALLVAVCLMWALNLVVTRWTVTVGDVPPIFFAAIRVTLLAAVLAPFLLPAPRQIGIMFLIAMGMAGIHFGLLFLGLAESTAGVAAVSAASPLSQRERGEMPTSRTALRCCRVR